MKIDDNTNAPVFPPGFAEELAAALEAATGVCQVVGPADPLTAASTRAALDAVLLAARPDRGLDVLVRAGVLEVVIPEVAALVGFGEGIRHKDVWAHTKQVVRQTPPRLVVRWSGLLHDVGKVPTRRFESDGTVSFIGHPEVGARMFERVAKRLPFTEEERERLKFLVAGHLRAAAYADSWTDSAVRRFARDAGECLEDLLDLARADITSKYAEKVRRGLKQINALAERIEALQTEDAKPVPLPKGLGTALIEELGVAPGPGLGKLMAWLKREVEDGRLGAQGDFAQYVERLKGDSALIESIVGRR